MDDPQAFADAHIAAFNDAVLTQDFNRFIERFSDDAKMRFENVPGAGDLEFNGSPAIAAAYAQQPPDDEIVLTGPARSDGEAVVIPFAWRRDGAEGVLRLRTRYGLIHEATVTFTAGSDEGS